METFKTSIFTRSALRPMLLLGALLAALPGACGGKVVIDQGEGEGGGGTSPSSTSVSTGSVGTTSTSVTVGQGGGTPGPCKACGEFLTGGEGTLCPASQPFYDELFFCVCADQCIPQCTGNVCSGGDINGDCAGCMSKLCQEQFNQCANDV